MARTHCDNGHDFAIEGTYTFASGQVACRRCARDRSKARLRPHVVKLTLPERIESQLVTVPSGCREYGGNRNKAGYGRISIGHKTYQVHRLAWELANGEEIPDGMLVRHTCDNPPCSEPTHLLLGTDADNVADKMARGRWRGGPKRTKGRV